MADDELSKALGEAQKTGELRLTNADDDVVHRAASEIEARAIKVVSVNLRLCRKVTDEGVKALAIIPGLRTLHLGSTKITDEVVPSLAKIQGLQELDLTWTHLTHVGFQALARIRRLRSLKVNATEVTDADIEALLPIQGLQELSLDACKHITDEVVHTLAQFPSLRTLNISSTSVTDEGVKALTKLPQLQKLFLVNCWHITDTGIQFLVKINGLQELLLSACNQVTDIGVQALAKIPALRSLNLMSIQVGDEGVKAVAQIQGLQELHLPRCMQVTDTVVQALAQVQGLQILVLWGCEQITDEGVRALAQAQRLQKLDLSHTRITDEGVRTLVRIAGLRTLYLRSCEQVTDEGVQALAKHQGLQELDLSSCEQVTDEGVQALAQVPGLQILGLRGTQVSLPEQMKESTDAQAVLKYLFEAKMLLREVKICVLGMGRTGKSILSSRLAPQEGEDPRAPLEHGRSSTHEFDVRSRDIIINRGQNKIKCRLRLFDFGGQQELHGAHRFFLADQRNVYVIVVSRRNSAAENRLDYWLRLVSMQGKGAPVVVVVSHCDDQADAVGPPPGPYQRQQLEELNQASLQQHYKIPIEIVDEYSNTRPDDAVAVQEAIERALAGLDHVFERDKFPPPFFKLKDWLEGEEVPELSKLALGETQEEYTYHSMAFFRQACQTLGQGDPKQQQFWMILLRDLGVLHWVGDRPEVAGRSELEEFFFNPKWIKRPVYSIVRAASDKHGLLPVTRIASILNQQNVHSSADQRRVIGLMAACELCFESHAPQAGRAFLVVDGVPTTHRGFTAPAPKLDLKERFVWSFAFLPDHLLAQLLGRWFHRHEHEVQFLRDQIGLYSADRRSLARLTADPGEHRIELSFFAKEGGDWRRLHDEIGSEIEKILLGRVRGEGDEDQLWEEESRSDGERMKLTQAEQDLFNETLDAIRRNAIAQKREPSEWDAMILRRELTDCFLWSKDKLSPSECVAFRACLLYHVHEKKGPFEDAIPALQYLKESYKDVGEWLQKEGYKVKAKLIEANPKKVDTLDPSKTAKEVFGRLRRPYTDSVRKWRQRPRRGLPPWSSEQPADI